MDRVKNAHSLSSLNLALRISLVCSWIISSWNVPPSTAGSTNFASSGQLLVTATASGLRTNSSTCPGILKLLNHVLMLSVGLFSNTWTLVTAVLFVGVSHSVGKCSFFPRQPGIGPSSPKKCLPFQTALPRLHPHLGVTG